MSLVRGTVAAQGQAWSTSLLRYVDLTVNASGELVTTTGSGGSGLTDAQLRATPVPVTDAALAPGYPEGDTTTPATGTVALVRNLSGALVPLSLGESGDILVTFPNGARIGVSAESGDVLDHKNFDFDTGAGSDPRSAFGIMIPKAGGGVLAGTSTEPLRTDPTGTTTQPVSVTNAFALESTAENIEFAVEQVATIISAGRGLVTEDNSAAIKTAVQIMDDWDEADRAKVNPIAGQVGVAGGTGADSALTQRVSLATNVALPAGTNILGKVGIDQTTPGTTNAVAVTNAFALEATLQSVKTAAEVIDNFISGARGLVTEDNSASIKAAVETIDNFISGARGLVTEDNSAAILTELTAKTEPADQQHTIVDSVVGTASTANSSTALLAANAAFTGTYEDIKNYAGIVVSVFADSASATNGFEFQWSSDGTNLDRSEKSSVLVSTGRAFNLSARARYFRIKYTNGADAQTAFRLSTIFLPVTSGVITKPLSGTVTDDNFAQSVQAAVMGRLPTATYINLAADERGRLNVYNEHTLVLNAVVDLLTDLRTELRVLQTMTAIGLNISEAHERWRSDPYYTSSS